MLLSATGGARDFSGVSSYPQVSSGKGGTAARKFALDSQLVNALSIIKSHHTGKLENLRPGITEMKCT